MEDNLSIRPLSSAEAIGIGLHEVSIGIEAIGIGLHEVSIGIGLHEVSWGEGGARGATGRRKKAISFPEPAILGKETKALG